MRAGLVAARIGAALALGTAALWVLWPFLRPIGWAAILAYLTWPLFRRLRSRSAHPALAAAAFTASVAVMIGVPVALMLIALADQAPALVAAVRQWLAESQWLRSWFDLPADATEWLSWSGRQLSGRLVAIAGGIARNAAAFGIMLVTLYSFYLNGERLAEIGTRLAPLLFPRAPERFLERIGESVQAVMFGLIGTALVQGVLAGLGMAVAGVPNSVALGAATVVLSFVPGGGGALTLASAVWLGFHGHWLAAILLALWALLVVSSVDNLLRPILIGERGRIPFLLVFFGVLGGLASFGLLGLFLGPVLLSVTATLVMEWSKMPEPASAAGD